MHRMSTIIVLNLPYLECLESLPQFSLRHSIICINQSQILPGYVRCVSTCQFRLTWLIIAC
jgi:hypothetical protein